jgi:hypothetical protein
MRKATSMAPCDLLRALDLLGAGDWHGAHALAQADPSPFGSWCHGIVHMLEPDEDNSRYWYRRAARAFPGMGTAEQEIAALRRVLGDPAAS